MFRQSASRGSTGRHDCLPELNVHVCSKWNFITDAHFPAIDYICSIDGKWFGLYRLTHPDDSCQSNHSGEYEFSHRYVHSLVGQYYADHGLSTPNNSQAEKSKSQVGCS
jgi:hypothetical protein